MCYSGKCYWECHSGDCNFLRIKAVRDKYPFPVSIIPDSPEFDEEYVNEVIDDIRNMINKR